MKKIGLIAIMLYACCFISFGQNDTIIVYKSNYHELNIPAGWEKFLLKSGDSLIEFFTIESMDTSFFDMLSISPKTKQGRKLYKELTKFDKTSDMKPMQYRDIGILYIKSYQIIGSILIERRNKVFIDSVQEYSEINVDIEDLKLALKLFDE